MFSDIFHGEVHLLLNDNLQSKLIQKAFGFWLKTHVQRYVPQIFASNLM